MTYPPDMVGVVDAEGGIVVSSLSVRFTSLQLLHLRALSQPGKEDLVMDCILIRGSQAHILCNNVLS